MFALFLPFRRSTLRNYRYIRTRFVRRVALSVLLPILLTVGADAQTRTLTWRWMNTPCGNVLNCHTGCSACNLPDEQDAVLVGTNAAWIGVTTCPQPFGMGDNAVVSEGWDLAPREDRMVILGAVHLDELRLTGLRIRHAAWGDGAMRLEVGLSLGHQEPFVPVWDGPVPSDLAWLDLSELGCSPVHSDGSPGAFRVRLRAYGDPSGSWLLDEVLMVTEPCVTGITTGVVALDPRMSNAERRTGPVDALGRRVGAQAAAGAYHNGTRKVVVW